MQKMYFEEKDDYFKHLVLLKTRKVARCCENSCMCVHIASNLSKTGKLHLKHPKKHINDNRAMHKLKVPYDISNLL